MNKHEVLLDMLLNKILFVSDRCNHDDDKTFLSENLAFLSLIAQIESSAIKSKVLTHSSKDLEASESFKNAISEILPNRMSISSVVRDFTLSSSFIASSSLQTVESDSNIDDFSDSNASKTVDDSSLNICEIAISTYYNFARKKNCKLFTLTIIPKASLITGPRLSKTHSRNKTYLCESNVKYKRCCDNSSHLNSSYEFETLSTIFYIQISEPETLTFNQIKEKLFAKYHNFANVRYRPK